MKKLFSLVILALAFLMETACVVPISMPGIAVQTTGIPFVGRNQVVVSCPASLSRIKVEKIDQYGTETFSVLPGASIGIRASGWYSDQSMVLVVYGYRNGKDGKPVFVGRKSRDFRFYDSGNSGQMIVWDVSSQDLESR